VHTLRGGGGACASTLLKSHTHYSPGSHGAVLIFSKGTFLIHLVTHLVSLLLPFYFYAAMGKQTTPTVCTASSCLRLILLHGKQQYTILTAAACQHFLQAATLFTAGHAVRSLPVRTLATAGCPFKGLRHPMHVMPHISCT